MAGRNANIAVSITGEAEFDAARADAKRAIDDIEKAGKGIELSAELDTTEIRQAIDLAKQLDGLTASMTIDTDASEIVQAEALARSLRGFQARVDLSVDGKDELRDALNLSEQMDRLRTVRLEVQGRQDLERAAEIADDLERRRTVPIDAQASDLVRLDDQVGDAITSGGEAGAEGLAGALADVDYSDIGSSAAEQMSGALAAAGPWMAAAAAIGGLVGEELLTGFNNALPDTRGDAIRALRNNLPASDLAEVGEAGGAAYSSGLSEGLTEAKDAAALIRGELGGIDDDLDLTEVTRQATALEQVFGTDMATSVAAVDKLLSQGLIKNSEEGFNLLFELGQKTGTQFDEMLELTSEFSTAIKALGIDGPRGLKLIGEMVEQGIFPQVDQAGEVFEELNETIISGGAHDALEQLGVDADQMTQMIAAGGPIAAGAVEEIAKQLLATDDNAEQAALTAAIFGGNMGLLGDEARESALQLFATAAGTTEVGNAASSAADKIEESASGMDRLKKVAVDLGNELGTTAADALDLGTALSEADWDTVGAKAASLGETLATKLGGPLFEISDRLGFDPFGPFKDGLDALSGKTEELPPKLGHTIDKMTETATASNDLAGATDELSGGFEDAAAAADELEAQLRGMFDFSADQLMRDVAEAADDLAASLADGGAKAVGMSGDIDISTEAGRKLQEQLEGVNGTLIDAEVAYANQEISAAQLADVHASLRNQLAEAGREAGLTKDQVQRLTDKYLAVPEGVTTDFTANTSTAINNVSALQQAINNIKSKSITISASISGPTGISASGILRRASGGWAEGLTLVGEEGPELLDIKGRQFVHNARATEEILSGQGTPVGAVAGSRGRSFIENATFVVDKGVDLWQQAQLAETVYGAL